MFIMLEMDMDNCHDLTFIYQLDFSWRWVLKKHNGGYSSGQQKDNETYLPKVRLASGAAGRPERYGLQWWAQISRTSANVLVGTGLSASAIRLQDACVLGILNGAEII